MATKPVLRRAIAGQKSKASDYNWNFDQMINYLDNSVGELENETETINQTKATTSLDNLTDGGKAKFDSKWASNTTQIFANANLSSSTYLEYTLDFLPDNGEYELMCNYSITPGASNVYARLYLADESETFIWLNGLNSNTNYNTQLQGSSIVVIKNKKIKAKKSSWRKWQ